MLSDIKCGLCDEFLKRGHGNERAILITRHFREKHPAEYEEIRNARLKVEELTRQYKYNSYL